MAKGKGWPKIGTLRRGENQTTAEKYSYIVLENNVQILVDGQEIALSKNRRVNLEDPRVKVKQLLDKGIIDEATADKRLEMLSENDWLRYELIVPPPKAE